MPFKSEAQRRYLWANEPEIARDWTETYGSKIQKANGGITRLNYRYGGDTMGGPNDKGGRGPAGGASAGGNYGGDSSGGVSARDMSNTRNQGPAGSRPGPQNTVDPGFQNALNAAAKRQATIKASQDPNYGQFFKYKSSCSYNTYFRSKDWSRYRKLCIRSWRLYNKWWNVGSTS